MNTDKLVRIGLALLGGGILFVYLVYDIDVELENWTINLAYKFAIVAPGLVVGSVLVAGGVNTYKLIRIGLALLGGGILFVGLAYGAGLAVSWATESAYHFINIAPGLVVGSVLIAGAWTGRIADRGFTGSCIILAGATLMAGDNVSNVTRGLFPDSIIGPYSILTFGPVGAALGAPLLVIGIRAFLRERMSGLCMIIPGAGFLPYAAYSIILPLVWPLPDTSEDLQFPGISEGLQLLHEITDVIHLFGSLVVGAAMVAVGLATVWQARRTRSDHAPVAAQI
ncbi:MAG: hypothetical protein D9C04_04130 [Nitrosopumilus sp. B06]|nr:MAG: hypothetical protein D9C04_04130 [Nitrosopumilus sp. B06]